MSKKTVFIVVTVIGVLALLAGLAVLIWWLVDGRHEYSTIELDGDNLGNIYFKAAFTRIRNVGDIFWWFFPAVANSMTTRPIILWLDGITGAPPSVLANFGIFGPYFFDLDIRRDSWIYQYNLLFVDAPLGTGFSAPLDGYEIPNNIEEHVDHLMYMMESFYSLHTDYSAAPLYICGQGQGAQLALSLAVRLSQADHISHNLTGVVIGNGIVAPSLVLTKLGFYLEELGYIDGNGRQSIETLSNETSTLVGQGELEEAFDKFVTLGEFVNENAGAVAVNLGTIIDKLTPESSQVSDYFGLAKYLENHFGLDLNNYMDTTIGTALGINRDVKYDEHREAATRAFISFFMTSSVDKVEYLLENTAVNVAIYNGNLDAVSNTPGQLEWVDNLQWSGQDEFRNQPRITLVLNSFVEGYFRETERLKFYWINAAGQTTALDNPIAMRRVMERITGI